MAKYNVTKISLVLNSIILSMLGVASAQYAELPKKDEPYPSDPVGMQTYINKTTPNVAIIIDNSLTMEHKISKKVLGAHVPSSKRPRRIDAVKDALLQIFNDHYRQLNFSYINITDGTRDLHWKIDPTQPTGFDFAPYTGDSHMEKYTSSTYEKLPISGKRKETTPGTARDSRSSFYDNRNRALIKPVVIKEEELPETALILSKTARKRVGKALLVPYRDVSALGYDPNAHKQALDLAAKTTGLSVGYLQYVYPNAVEYMKNKIQYRCQDTFFLILTDGNTLLKSDNKAAAIKYAFLKGQTDPKILAENARKGIRQHPKSSTEKDKDGYYYNGPDFPSQSIRSFAIGIGTKESSFNKFTTIGGGKSAVANSSEDIAALMKEFILEMLPSNKFSMTSVTGSFLYNNDSSSALMANIETETKGWVGELRFINTLPNAGNTDEKLDVMEAKYLPNHAVYIASTNKGLIDLSSQKAKTLLTHKDLNLQTNISIESYLKWLTAYTEVETYWDEDAKENITTLSGDNTEEFAHFRTRSASALSENRYLGDVLSNSLEMMGPMDNLLKAPRYLTFGSNDGMFKIYKANPDYDQYLGRVKDPIYDEDDSSKIIGYDEYDSYDTYPYIYSFAYIPGTIQKNNGLNVLQSMAIRATPNYSKALLPAHQYNVNGETAFRTTNKGHTFLVATLGQGGKGAFALNIAGTDQILGDPVGMDTDKNQWATNVPLWDTSTDKFGYAADGSKTLGYIIGKPVISRIALVRNQKLPLLNQNVKYAAVLPSGTHGDASDKELGPTVYIYDALGVDVGTHANANNNRTPGKLIKKVTYKLDETQKQTFKYPNSLSELTLIDLDLDGVSDIGYTGDLNGNLYRLDLRGNTIDDWKLELIFEGDPSRPILNAPSMSRFFQKSIVIFGTGSLSRDEVTKDRPQQILYGLLENKTFTAHQNNPVRHDDKRLIAQSITKRGETATVTDERPSWNGFVGWKLPLGFGQDTGESLSQKPIILNGTIFFQTYIYRDYQDKPNSGLMCFKTLDAADTWVYQINALTGGALDSNSTYLKALGNKGGVAGKKTKGSIEQPVKLIEANKSRPVSKDGESLSGNDKDAELKPEASSKDNFDLPDENYITEEECKALLSNGMEIKCPTKVVNPFKEDLKPGRISIQQIL